MIFFNHSLIVGLVQLHYSLGEIYGSRSESKYKDEKKVKNVFLETLSGLIKTQLIVGSILVMPLFLRKKTEKFCLL